MDLAIDGMVNIGSCRMHRFGSVSGLSVHPRGLSINMACQTQTNLRRASLSAGRSRRAGHC